MNITISHPEFKTQLLEIKLSGYFAADLILLNGAVVKPESGFYTVLNDQGQEVNIELNSSLFYRLPQLLIEQEPVIISGRAGWKQFRGWKNTWIAHSLTALVRLPVLLLRMKRQDRVV